MMWGCLFPNARSTHTRCTGTEHGLDATSSSSCCSGGGHPRPPLTANHPVWANQTQSPHPWSSPKEPEGASCLGASYEGLPMLYHVPLDYWLLQTKKPFGKLNLSPQLESDWVGGNLSSLPIFAPQSPGVHINNDKGPGTPSRKWEWHPSHRFPVENTSPGGNGEGKGPVQLNSPSFSSRPKTCWKPQTCSIPNTLD